MPSLPPEIEIAIGAAVVGGTVTLAGILVSAWIGARSAFVAETKALNDILRERIHDLEAQVSDLTLRLARALRSK